MDHAEIVVLLAYGSLGVELTLFPIPSEASTLDLLTHGGDGTASGALSQARDRSIAAKLLLFLLPTAIGVVLFLMPLVLWWLSKSEHAKCITVPKWHFPHCRAPSQECLSCCSNIS